jgi:hypothetical protein
VKAYRGFESLSHRHSDGEVVSRISEQFQIFEFTAGFAGKPPCESGKVAPRSLKRAQIALPSPGHHRLVEFSLFRRSNTLARWSAIDRPRRETASRINDLPMG